MQVQILSGIFIDNLIFFIRGKKIVYTNESKNRTKKIKRISCIANNTEKFISFKFAQLKFIDSFAFMSSSLDNLVKILPQNKFINFNKQLKSDGLNDSQINLLLQINSIYFHLKNIKIEI